MQRHPARREVDSRPQWPWAAHVESVRVVDPKCLKLRMFPVGYCYFMHTQMSKAVRIALYVQSGPVYLDSSLSAIHQGNSH